MKKFILMITAFLVSAVVQAQALDIAFGKNRPPFVFQEEGKWQGIEVDIVREALKFSGHSIKRTLHVSNKRLELVIEQLGLDVAVKVKATNDSIHYSQVFLVHQNYAISRTLDGLQVNSINDLSRYSVSAWQNAKQHLGPLFADVISPKTLSSAGGEYAEFVDQEAQSLLFWRKKTDVIVVDRNIFLWNKKKIAEKYDTSFNLTYHDIFPKKTSFKVAFKDSAIRDDFDEGLRYLYQTGQYQKLIDNYTY